VDPHQRLAVSIETRHHVLILQHPQEPGVELGTASLAHELLPNSTLRVGLSWPNLSKALGREVTPSKWVVLYLGAKTGDAAPTSRGPLTLVSKKGLPLPDQHAVLPTLEGLVVLDGTWSQAKALWWRNAWLLKLRRGVLVPTRPSLYGKLRKEPRPDALSTIESIGLALTGLGEPPQVEEGLRDAFTEFLATRRPT
jgi:DTW domain-containing protein YfiP